MTILQKIVASIAIFVFDRIDIEKHPKLERFFNRLGYFRTFRSFCLQHRYNAIVKAKYALGCVAQIEIPKLPNQQDANLTAITKICQELGDNFGKKKIDYNAEEWKTAYVSNSEWFYVKTPKLNLRFCLITENLMEIQFYATKKVYAMNRFLNGRVYKSFKEELELICERFNESTYPEELFAEN